MIRRAFVLLCITFAFISTTSAAVTRIEITEREPYEQGKVIEGDWTLRVDSWASGICG